MSSGASSGLGGFPLRLKASSCKCMELHISRCVERDRGAQLDGIGRLAVLRRHTGVLCVTVADVATGCDSRAQAHELQEIIETLRNADDVELGQDG